MSSTELAYDSKDFEHWTSCSCIVHMLGWLFLCIFCSWCFSKLLLFAEKSYLLHSNIFQMLRCHSLKRRRDERWTNTCHIIFWTWAAPLHILCMGMTNTSFIEVALMVRVGDKAIMFSVHMYSKKAFLCNVNLHSSHCNNSFSLMLFRIPWSQILCLLRV